MGWPIGKMSTICRNNEERAKMRIFEGGEKWPWLHLCEHKEHGGGVQGERMSRGYVGLNLKQGR